MGANNFTGGSQNYYGVAYGYLSTKTNSNLGREVEFTEAELKSKTQNIEQLDLRKAFIKKDEKYTIFFPSIEGLIKDLRKEKNEHGTFLVIELLDKDLETSLVTTKLHNKYSANFLNRFVNIIDISNKIRLAPYSMPSTHKESGKRFYNSGIAVYEEGEKVEAHFKYDDLPEKKEVEVKGQATYDNTVQIDFLFNNAIQHFMELKSLEKSTITNSTPFEMTTDFNEKEHDDLPF